MVFICCQSVSQFSHSVISDFVTPWIAAHQGSQSITNSQRLSKLMSIKWVLPSHPLSSPSPPAFNLPQHQSFPMSPFFASGGQSIGVSASASVLLMNIQDWFPLGWASWISLNSKGLSRVFYTTVPKHQFFGTQLSFFLYKSWMSNSHIHTWLLEKS